MLGMLFHAHSGVRYLVLAAGVAALFALAACVARGRQPGRLERGLLRAFTGALDLQVLLGVLLLLQIPFYGALTGHLVMMLAAAAVLHGVAVMDRRRAPDSTGRAMVLMLAVAAALLLIVGGIMAIGRPLLGSGLA